MDDVIRGKPLDVLRAVLRRRSARMPRGMNSTDLDQEPDETPDTLDEMEGRRRRRRSRDDD